MLLEEIEEAVPYQQIYIDKSQNRVSEDISDERKTEIADKARMLVLLAQTTGKESKQDIIEKLMQAEPFNKIPELRKMLMEE